MRNNQSSKGERGAIEEQIDQRLAHIYLLQGNAGSFDFAEAVSVIVLDVVDS